MDRRSVIQKQQGLAYLVVTLGGGRHEKFAQCLSASFLAPKSEESHISWQFYEQKEAPITFCTSLIPPSWWHPQCFRGEQVKLPSCRVSLQNHEESCDRPCFSPQLCPCLSPLGGLQRAFPGATAGWHHILTSHACVKCWGLHCCMGAVWGRSGSTLSPTNSLCMFPYCRVTHLAYMEHPCESHLKVHNVDGGKGQSWGQTYKLIFEVHRQFCMSRCLGIKLVVELLCQCLCCFRCELSKNHCW